jgi:hypothetical protein
MKSALQIRKDVQKIIDSKSDNLAQALTDYIVRVRNEAYHSHGIQNPEELRKIIRKYTAKPAE